MIIGLRTATLLGGLLCATGALAGEQFGPFEKVDEQPLKEIWLTSGFETWHFDSSLGLNDHNHGWGIDYRYSTTTSLTAGKFLNSDWQDSRYLGFSWHPLTFGRFRFGAYVGFFDGYPAMHDGGTFVAVVPAIAMEYERIGFNLAIVPTIQQRMYGGISLQLKLKVY